MGNGKWGKGKGERGWEVDKGKVESENGKGEVKVQREGE